MELSQEVIGTAFVAGQSAKLLRAEFVLGNGSGKGRKWAVGWGTLKGRRITNCVAC